MTKPTTWDQQSTDKTAETMSLSEAVRIVRKAIAAEEARLERIANGEWYGPVMVQGENAEGEEVQVFVAPEDVVQIMQDCRSPLYKVLKEDAPQEMWDRLGELTGLSNIYFVEV